MTYGSKVLSCIRNPKKIWDKITGTVCQIKQKNASKRAAEQIESIPSASLTLPVLDRDPEFVVSLTSYGDRLNSVHLAIRSVMAQTRKPDLVVLYIDEDTELESLPSEIQQLQKQGLLVRQGVPNLRAHTKYYFAMQEFPCSNIITIDDDVIYPASFLESLCKAFKNHPGCIIARRVHKIEFDEAGDLLPYNMWHYEWTEDHPIPRHSLLATGVGGVLYPKSCFGQTAFDIELMKKLSFQADDLWLKAMEIIHGLPVVYALNDNSKSHMIEGTQDAGLFHANVIGRANDLQMRKLFDHFQFTQADFADDEV